MKTMKISKITIQLLFSLVLLLQACQKDNIKPAITSEEIEVKSINEEIPVVESSELVDSNDNQVKSLLHSEDVRNGSFKFQGATFYKIRFKGLTTFIGIHVKFKVGDSSRKDLFHVSESQTNTELTVIRDKIGFQRQDIGRIIFKDINGKELANDYFDHQKIIQSKSILLENIPSFTDSNNQFKLMSNSWNCTSAQFNAYYQKAKNNCGNDWLCDFACSFNPCAISYVAYAVGRCTGILK